MKKPFIGIGPGDFKAVIAWMIMFVNTFDDKNKRAPAYKWSLFRLMSRLIEGVSPNFCPVEHPVVLRAIRQSQSAFSFASGLKPIAFSAGWISGFAMKLFHTTPLR